MRIPLEKQALPTDPAFFALRRQLHERRLHTVCEEARCPNRGDCWTRGEVAFMILGDTCTRHCAFCGVQTGRPAPPDPDEPARLAETVSTLQVKHVVITSVTRDDLPDGGAEQFRACTAAIRERAPTATVELLIPDFRHQPDALPHLLRAEPDILNHNIETVPRLYPSIRPAARYEGSLALLRRALELASRKMRTKSGLMVGLGEQPAEVDAVLHDLRQAGVTQLTIGHYLPPSRHHTPVVNPVPAEQFTVWKTRALELGFRRVISHPLARSSLHAADMA